ncbi:alpha/beta hydrolase family protein [Thermogemmatispora sp.]|uniref:alpha/beta hydrolase family protein n=1 Tax=Thermogemmatispora sp. TaxID=1968838 RepID=UPI0035E438C5
MPTQAASSPTGSVAQGAGPSAHSARRSRPAHRRAAFLAQGALTLLTLLGLGLSLTPWGRAGLRTGLLLPALLSVSQGPAFTLFGEPISFRRTTLPSPVSGSIYLDLYAPENSAPLIPGRRQALVVIAGLGDNRADSQLVNFARSLAGDGMVVAIVGTPALFDFVLRREDSAAVVQVFELLARRPDVDPAHIGLVGFSAGNALACFAAADPRIRHQVAFVLSFGGFFEATTLLAAIATHQLEVDGRKQSWTPYYVPLQALAHTLSTILPPHEAALLRAAFAQNGRPLTAAELSQLAPSTRAAYHLLAGDQPQRVAANLAALSPQMRALLTQLSPARVVAAIAAPVFLLHDRSDAYVPFTETLAFAAALERLHHPYDLAEFGIFQHVEVRSGLSPLQLLGDSSRLATIVWKITLVGS